MVLQLQQGKVFNIEAGKQAVRNLNSLSLFSNIEVFPRPDEKREGGIILEIKLKESKQKSTEVEANWSIVPGGGFLPTLVIYIFFVIVFYIEFNVRSCMQVVLILFCIFSRLQSNQEELFHSSTGI